MLKIVVFDSGFGGELFADRLEEELPIVEVIRVIAWRDAKDILTSPKLARKIAEKSLTPYFGKVDLIVFANYLLSATSLKYFRHKYKNQKFTGFCLDKEQIVGKRPVLILTTKAVSKTFSCFSVAHNCKAKVATFDEWPALIDDGELTNHKIAQDLKLSLGEDYAPHQVLLACGQFVDIKDNFRNYFGHNTRILDSFDQTFRESCQMLKIRGALHKKSS